MTKTTGLFFLVVLLGGLPAQAQNTSGEIQDAAWGLRFTPPQGWIQHQAAEGYLFAGPGQQGLLAVLPHETPTVEALEAEARQGIQDGAGTALQLQGPLEAFSDNGLAGDFSGWIEGSPARARIVGLVAPHGRGATILVAAAPQQYSGATGAIAEAVARSVVFTAKQAASSATATTSSEAQEWADWFQGCRLSYFNRYSSSPGSGYVDETIIDLCPGYFLYGDESGSNFGPGSMASQKRGAGQWQVVQQGDEVVLQLHFNDGSSNAYTLGYEDGKTYLNGRRWLRTCNPNDQVVEARPRCQ